MKRASSHLVAAWLLCGALPGLGIGLAPAAEPTGDAAERERISTERAAVETRFAEQRLACQQNFVVTSCVDEVRRREREALGSLRRQESLLDETQRRQRAAERAAAIRVKISAEEDRQRAPAPQGDLPLQTVAPRVGPAARAASEPKPAATPGPTAAQRESRGSRELRESRGRARFEARQSEAREHREAAQRRSVERARQDRPAAPLPSVAPASSP